MKKRYIIFALAALELGSLPAVAKLMHHNSEQFQKLSRSAVKPSVIQVPNDRAGQKHFLISSKQPFTIVVEEQNIDENREFQTYEIQVSQKGNIMGLEYGDRAQMPGEATSCRLHSSSKPATLFESDTGTIKGRGGFKQKSVLISIAYPVKAEPEFKFIHSRDALAYSPAPSCESPA